MATYRLREVLVALTISAAISVVTLIPLANAAGTSDLPAEFHDVTDRVTVSASGFRKDLRTGELVQRITLVNTSRETVHGSLHLILEGLGPESKPLDATNKLIGSLAENGVVILQLQNEEQGKNNLEPGQEIHQLLRFRADDGEKFLYRTRVYEEIAK